MAKKKPYSLPKIAPTPVPESEQMNTTATGQQPFTDSVAPVPEFKTDYHKRIGISPETLKAIWVKSQGELEQSDIGRKQNKFLQLIVNRIKDGRFSNFRNFRVWAAIDEAYDAPFHQVNATLIQKILEKNIDAKGIMDALKDWGIDDGVLFSDGPIVAGQKTRVLNRDTFSKILVPVVKPYITIRGGKLFDDRNQSPFLKYEPQINTELTRMIGEIVTNLVDKMTHQMGLREVLREVIIHALLYSEALVLPYEAWYYELDKTSDGEEYSTKEGLRYHVPHPSRMFRDLNYSPSTFNTDTGCSYAGWWRIMRYGEIETNAGFYNKDKIPFGQNWFHNSISGNYFTEVFPCTIATPLPISNLEWQDKSDSAAAFYTSDYFDKAVFVTDFFIKVIPADWGLGDWKYQTWFRVILASDQTIIFMEPLPFCPVLYCGADTVASRGRNPSFALEIVPFQLQLGNILTLIYLAGKQNLAKIIYYDTEVVQLEDIEKVRHQSRDSSGLLFVPYSSKQLRSTQGSYDTAFKNIQFPLQNVAELTGMLMTTITVMERMLGMSAQEVGAPGTHVQSATETRIISANTSVRVDYTGSFVDAFMDGWKRQIYLASQEFMDETFVAEVTATSPDKLQMLKDIGFELSEDVYDGKVKVEGKKNLLVLEGFISSRDGQSRINEPEIAQLMMQTLSAIAANQILVQQIGPEQIIAGINMAMQMAGAPRDWKLKIDPMNQAQQQQQMQQLQQQLQEMAKEIEQAAVQESVKQVQPLVDQVKAHGQAIQTVAEKTQETGQAVQQVSQQSQGQDQAVGSAIQQLAQQVKQTQAMLASLIQSQPPVVTPGSPEAQFPATMVRPIAEFGPITGQRNNPGVGRPEFAPTPPPQ